MRRPLRRSDVTLWRGFWWSADVGYENAGSTMTFHSGGFGCVYTFFLVSAGHAGVAFGKAVRWLVG